MNHPYVIKLLGVYHLLKGQYTKVSLKNIRLHFSDYVIRITSLDQYIFENFIEK